MKSKEKDVNKLMAYLLSAGVR